MSMSSVSCSFILHYFLDRYDPDVVKENIVSHQFAVIFTMSSKVYIIFVSQFEQCYVLNPLIRVLSLGLNLTCFQAPWMNQIVSSSSLNCLSLVFYSMKLIYSSFVFFILATYCLTFRILSFFNV